jgi:hypothetical protein
MATLRDGRSAPTGHVKLVDHSHAVPARPQPHGRGETAQTGTDHNGMWRKSAGGFVY